MTMEWAASYFRQDNGDGAAPRISFPGRTSPPPNRTSGLLYRAGRGERLAEESPNRVTRPTPPADGLQAGDGPSDPDLVRSAAAGDRAAFHALVDRHAKMMFRVALSLSHNRADAEDAVQEAFTGAYRGLAKFDGRASVKTWLTQILIRQSAKQWHRSKRSRQSLSLDTTERPDADERLSVPSESEGVDRRMDLMSVIHGLPEDHRQVILLREVEGKSYDEMARELGVPRGTVESRLHRARLALRQKLTGYGAPKAATKEVL